MVAWPAGSEWRTRRTQPKEQTMRKFTVILAAFVALGMMAGPALANHTPTIAITSPSDDATLAAGTASTTIAGSLGVGENPARVTVTVNGVQKYDSGDSIQGAWSFPLSGLQNGETYEVIATGTHSGKSGTDTITFRVATQVTTNPVVKEDCFDGGWQDYGFINQGQCVRYVVNGKDSR
jgi:hypothetical protein